MSESPILFSTPMVRAVLEGRKTRTRRAIRPQPELCHGCQSCEFRRDHFTTPIKQSWREGDTLWVCENYALEPTPTPSCYLCKYDDGEARTVTLVPEEESKLLARKSPITKKRPGRFMYRSCSRILLEVKEVQVKRLQDITEEEAIAEGIERQETYRGGRWYFCGYRDYSGKRDRLPAIESFRSLWELINGAGSWDANPWVRDVEFRRVE